MNGYLLRTTNSGINWNIATDSSSHVYYFQFINDTLGYSTGMNYLTPVFQKTTNGGVNWATIYYPTPFALGSINFINSDTGWASGFIFPGTVVIEKTTNGGQTFENLYTGAGSPGGGDTRLIIIKDASSNEYYGYHYFNGNLYKSTNSGYNWTQLSFIEAGSVNSFSFINKDTGFVVYNPNVGNNTKILFTSNAGQNWSQSYYYNFNYGLGTIQIVNKDKIWCGGDYMIKSTSGGTNWGRQTCQIIYPSRVYMIDTTLGFAWNAYSLNNFVRTTNGGGPITAIVKSISTLPSSIDLKQNYPNPFNNSTIIEYSLIKKATIGINIYDISGRSVYDMTANNLEPGNYRLSLDFNLLNVPSGVYFYKFLVVNEKGTWVYSETKRLMYVK
jgi:photosystem II stability/assembly factor-like uncharacterized protein